MCMTGGSTPYTPSIPATPTSNDPAVQARLDAERQRQLQTKGLKSTVLAPLSMAPATTAPKTLLGE